MVCLGLKPGVAGREAQTNLLSYGGTPCFTNFAVKEARHNLAQQ